MINIKNKFGQGITPQQFIDRLRIINMELSNIPNTKERFIQTYENFAWSSESDRSYFTSLPFTGELRSIIICTDWCPDVIWNVPVLLRVMEQVKIPVEILIMDDHLETMDLFSGIGARTQPLALILNENGDCLGRWGARPNYIQQVMDEFKEKYKKEDLEYQKKLNRIYQKIGELYNSSNAYQQVVIEELADVFLTIQNNYFPRKGGA